MLAGKQTKQHRDVDIDFDVQYTNELLESLLYRYKLSQR